MSWTRLSELSLFTFMHWRRKWQPTPVFLPGESQGWGSLVGYHLWGCTESDTTEATQQQQVAAAAKWKDFQNKLNKNNQAVECMKYISYKNIQTFCLLKECLSMSAYLLTDTYKRKEIYICIKLKIRQQSKKVGHIIGSLYFLFSSLHLKFSVSTL